METKRKHENLLDVSYGLSYKLDNEARIFEINSVLFREHAYVDMQFTGMTDFISNDFKTDGRDIILQAFQCIH